MMDSFVFGPDPDQLSWIVVVGGIVAFAMSFGIGANDVANAFATSVGSKALKLWQAICIAAVMEFSGAILLGGSVTKTVRKGITNVELFEEAPAFLMFGMLCALFAASMWVFLATKMYLPVSTTHSIVGAILGFAMVWGAVLHENDPSFNGWDSVSWTGVGLIVLSWIVSPVLSGLFAIAVFIGCRKFILRQEDSLERGYIFYPLLVSFTISVNVYFILIKGNVEDHLELADDKNLERFYLALVSVGVWIVLMGVIQFFLMPMIKRGVERRFALETKQANAEDSNLKAIADQKNPVNESNDDNKNNNNNDDSDPSLAEMGEANNKTWLGRHKALWFGDALHANVKKQDTHTNTMHDSLERFDAKTEHLFVYLQVFTATFESFAHGANDVANAIAPFAAIVSIYQNNGIDEKSDTPPWILAFGGFGIVVGLAVFGHRIIQAIGVELVAVTPSRGFAIELASAFVIVIANVIGLPVSSTHCQVGATIAIGLIEGRKGESTNLWMVARIIASWIFTLIFAAGVSAAMYAFSIYSPSTLYVDKTG